MSYLELIATAISALAGGALGAWWQARRASKDLDKRIAHEREQARIERQYPDKRALYLQYNTAANRVFHAIVTFQSQRQRNAGDTTAPDFGKSEGELLTDVISAAQQLEVAADHLELIAPKKIVTKINEVSRQIGPALERAGLPPELSVPMREIYNMMRDDLGTDF